MLIKQRRLPIAEVFRIFKIQRPYMPMPLWIYLEPTTKCNFNCITCSRKSLLNSRINKSLSFDNFKYIVHEIPSLKRVHLQGLGEPLLTKDIWKIAQYAKIKGIQLTTTINGSLINQKNVQRLLRAFSGIGISIDSVIEENYNKIRIGGNYKKLIDNIQLLLKTKKELNINTEIKLNFVLTHLNFPELEDYLKLCLDLQVNCSVVEVENWYIPSQKQYLMESEFIRDARKISQDSLALMRKYRGAFEKAGQQWSHGSPLKRKNRCLWPFTSCYISFDGYVTPCCIRQDPAVVNFGNIFRTPFKKIWNSKNYQIFRNTHLKNMPNLICDNCPD